MKDYWYHHKEWLSFWHSNQTDTYGDDFRAWQSPEDLARVWYEEEYSPELGTGTVGYSAGVFIHEIEVPLR